MANDWAPEPIKCENGHLFDASGEFLVSPDCVMEQATGDRLAACYNACAEVPTECLIRVEQGKSSIIVADEVLNGQRAHFEMPESTITKEAADGRSDNKP